jgi:hypothetical protein
MVAAVAVMHACGRFRMWCQMGAGRRMGGLRLLVHKGCSVPACTLHLVLEGR